MKKRLLLIAASVAVAGGVGLMAPVIAADENAVHSGPGSHPHHIHTQNGECHDHPVNMEGGSRGLHQGSNKSGPDHGMWHGSCATHNNHD